jgi:hypothetical protein
MAVQFWVSEIVKAFLTDITISVSGRNLLCGVGEIPKGPEALNFLPFLVN